MGKAKIGRPTLYTPELAAEICRRIVVVGKGGKPNSVRSICLAVDMPHRDTVYSWLLEHKDFAERYGMAMQLRADQLFDECLDIADDTTRDRVKKKHSDDTTFEATDHEHIARSRLRVDTRKWMAGKLAPKKYGDRVLNEHMGEGGGPIKTKDVTTDRDRARALAAFVSKTRSRA